MCQYLLTFPPFYLPIDPGTFPPLFLLSYLPLFLPTFLLPFVLSHLPVSLWSYLPLFLPSTMLHSYLSTSSFISYPSTFLPASSVLQLYPPISFFPSLLDTATLLLDAYLASYLFTFLSAQIRLSFSFVSSSPYLPFFFLSFIPTYLPAFISIPLPS